MTKFTLSKPQRMLFGLAVVLFAVGIMWMVYFIFRDVTRQLNRGVAISYASVAPTDDNGPESQSLNYDEQITQPSGESILTWNGHTIYMFGPAQAVINPDTLNLSQGFAYVESSRPLTVSLSGRDLQINGIGGLYDAGVNGFIVMDGSWQLPDQETAQANTTILFDGAKFTTANFDRTQLTTDKWSRVSNLLAAKAQLPVTLADVVPPAISNILPANGFTTAAGSVTVSGTTEPGATVHIDKTAATVDAGGQFTAQVDLVTGINHVLITVLDKAGNEGDANLQYTRSSPAANAGNCDSLNSFSGHLLCLINVYRSQHNLQPLTMSTTLSTAALAHSNWMSSTGKLTNTEDNGSTPATRCNAAGTTCNAESIVQNAQLIPQTILDYWKSQGGDNANLLGTHTEIGIADSGQYVTADFH